jgi:drug/metabolite transporter (DMT)-like permease
VRHHSENRRGIVYMVSGMACFVVNDSIVKYVGQTLGVTQLVAVRGAMAVAMLAAVAWKTGAVEQWRTLVHRIVGWRLVLDALTTLTFIGSLMHLPIGNATAINLGAPLIIALLAVLFLHERPGWQRWIAIGGGFIGIVLVIQPKVDGFNAWSLLCLLSTVLQSVRDMITRQLPGAVPSILVGFAAVGFITLAAAGLTLVEGWQPVGHVELALLAVASVLLSAGYWFLISSMRHGEMTLVAPFRYSGLIVALVAGYIVWGEVPTPVAWSGIALLLAAGIYLLHGERKKREVDLPTA